MVWVQVVGRGSSLTGRRDGVARTWETRDAGLQRGLSRVALSPRENEEQALRKGAGLIHCSEYLFLLLLYSFWGSLKTPTSHHRVLHFSSCTVISIRLHPHCNNIHQAGNSLAWWEWGGGGRRAKCSPPTMLLLRSCLTRMEPGLPGLWG